VATRTIVAVIRIVELSMYRREVLGKRIADLLLQLTSEKQYGAVQGDRSPSIEAEAGYFTGQRSASFRQRWKH
jgi:hypothetical protein